MKKKLGMILLAAALFGTVAASTASPASAGGPNCIRDGNLWICEY